MIDGQQWCLRGMVKTCRLQTAWYSGRNPAKEEQSDTIVVEFRRDGAWERRWQRDPRGSQWIKIYEYDDSGRLVATRADGPDRWTESRVYNYDSAGRIDRVTARDASGRERVAETYAYDADGRKTRTRYVESEACADTYWGVEGTDACYSAPAVVSITTLYDDDDRPVTTLFRNAKDEIVTRVDLHYDHVGNLVEEAGVRASEQALAPELAGLPGVDGVPMRRFFKYDGHGRRIEIVIPFGDLGMYRKTITYNEEGDPSVEVSYDQGREHESDEEGRVSSVTDRDTVPESESRFRYQYDLHGNWVEKIAESRGGPVQDFAISVIERRTIMYFDYALRSDCDDRLREHPSCSLH